MHKNNLVFTTNQLVSIYGTTKTSLYNNIKKNNLRRWLIKNHHMNVSNYQTIFDIYALAKIGKTFENRNDKPKRKRNHKNNIPKYAINNLSKQVDQINKKLDKIINKMDINY